MEMSSQETPSDDFGFAFNQARFSDSVLRIETVPDSSGSRAEPDISLVLWSRNRKRQRDDQITNDDGHGTAGQEPETSSSMEVKTVHVSSPILAVKSPFFYKLFSDATRDSEQRHFTVRIHASEEDALMDMLNFIYCNTLRSTTPTALLNVLTAADKFEVASCVKHCSQLLQNLPISLESASVYLDLPSKIRMADTVQPLADAAKKYLVTRFKDIEKCREEVWKLPLSGFEALLSSDDLRVVSEDVLYDLVIRWAEKQHPINLKARRDLLSTRLLRHVRFPYMSYHGLKGVQCRVGVDIDPSLASEAVLNALFCKAQSPYSDRSLGSPSNPPPSRAYSLRPIRVVEFESPGQQQRICYLDLKREDCAQLFPSSRLYSQPFHIWGHEFYLTAHCCEEKGLRVFGLYLGIRGEEGPASSLMIGYEFASRVKKESLDFATKFRIKKKFTGGMYWGLHNLFGVPWNVFIADDSPYFIDGVLHLRAQLTVTKV